VNPVDGLKLLKKRKIILLCGNRTPVSPQISHNVITTDTNTVLFSRSIYCWEDCSRLTIAPGLGMTFMHTPASFSRTQCVADATDDVVRNGVRGEGRGGGRKRQRERERGGDCLSSPNYYRITTSLGVNQTISLFPHYMYHAIFLASSTFCSHIASLA